MDIIYLIKAFWGDFTRLVIDDGTDEMDVIDLTP